MAIPTIIKSTDAGAPTLDGDNGSMYNVLKWALPQLGWTIEYDDAANSVIAFRNNANTGTGTYFEVIDNSALTNNANGSICSLRAYETMSAPMTGDMVIGAPSGMELGFIKSTRVGANSADPIDYQIVGTDKQFYIINASNIITDGLAKSSSWGFVGDINSYNPNDNNRFMITGCSYTTAVSFGFANERQPVLCRGYTNSSYTNGSPAQPIARNYLATTTEAQTLFASSFPALTAANTSSSFNSGFVNNIRDPINNTLKTAYCIVADCNDLVYRGVLPGCLISLNKITPSYSLIYRPDTLFERKLITPNGKYSNCVMQCATSYFRSFGTSDNNRYMLILNVEEDWDTLI